MTGTNSGRIGDARLTWACATGLVACMAGSAAAQSAGERFWPQWRGPSASGASAHATPPTEWSETENVRWKVEIPGRGSATPVVWGDRLFLLTAVPVGVAGDASHQPLGGASTRPPHRYQVLAIDRGSGAIVWERTALEEAPHEGSHQDHGTWASSSAITDGTRVIAHFESKGIFAYDMDGAPLWQADLGDKRMRNEFGEGSSPVLHGDHLVVVWDHQGQSFVVALDSRTGEELWRRDREEIDTWSTPLVVEHDGRAQVVTNGMSRLRSYDLETGELVWESEGTTMNPIPSPVGADGMVFVTSGYRGSDLKAIRLDGAEGDLTGSANIVWSLDRDTPYVPSPLLYDGVLYILKSNDGLLSAFDARTGEPYYRVQRLDGVPNVFASPVAADGRVYVVGREGTTLVLRHGPTFEVLARNSLDDGFEASPALVDGEIYLRGFRHLYSIGTP